MGSVPKAPPFSLPLVERQAISLGRYGTRYTQTLTCRWGWARALAYYVRQFDKLVARCKVKIKVHTLDIAPLRSELPPQKRSGMARVLKGFHSFFYLRDIVSAVIATATWLAGWLAWWLSVTASIVSKRLNIS